MSTRPTARKDTVVSTSSSATLLEVRDSFGFPNVIDIEERVAEDDDTASPLDMQDPNMPVMLSEGAEVFGQFEKSIRTLDKELMNFLRFSNQLGGAAGILSSAFRLRERLAQIHCIFRQNASDLFPRVIPKRPYIPKVEPIRSSKTRKYRRYERIALLDLPTSNLNLNAEELPKQLLGLADDLNSFLDYLNGFDDFTDEGIDSSIRSFESDLRYWSDCFEDYSGRFKCPAVQHCVHTLQVEMELHMREVTVTLKMFTAIGLPIIQHAQKHGTTNLFNLATISTFFSSVTATTLQYSLQGPSTNLNSTNAFWFASLVFSVSATINSFVGLAWRQTMYRSPMHRVPWWVRLWIRNAAMICLALSVACFSTGLCCFTYKSQPELVSMVTITLVVLTTVGLAVVSLRLIVDRWLFRRRDWVMRFAEAWTGFISGLKSLSIALTLSGWYNNRYGAVKKGILNAKEAAFGIAQKIIGTFYHKCPKSGDIEKGEGSPSAGEPNRLPNSSRPCKDNTQADSGSLGISRSSTSQRDEVVDRPPLIPLITLDRAPVETIPHEVTTSTQSVRTLSSNGSTTPLDSPSNEFSEGRRLWFRAFGLVRSYINATRSMPPPSSKPSPVTPPITPAQLKRLAIAHQLREHTAFIKQLQFSPDGKHLVTTSWDSRAVVWKSGERFTVHAVLEDRQGFVGQVSWSPAGNLLVSKAKQHIKLWRMDGSCQRTICRSSESLSWFPDGKAIISIENGSAVKLDLGGKELEHFKFEHVQIQKAVVTKGDWLLGIGTLQTSKTGLKPGKACMQKRLIAYNMATGRQENQIPLPNDARHIGVAKDGVTIIVSYEKTPPQLWKLEVILNKSTGSFTGRLSSKHTFMTTSTVGFAGPGYFGGVNDELVLSAGKNGDVHIWNTKSGSLLRYIRAQSPGGNLTCIGWNGAAADPLMFATGSIDGTVQVWTNLSRKPKEYEIFGNVAGVSGESNGELTNSESKRQRQLKTHHID